MENTSLPLRTSSQHLPPSPLGPGLDSTSLPPGPGLDSTSLPSPSGTRSQHLPPPRTRSQHLPPPRDQVTTPFPSGTRSQHLSPGTRSGQHLPPFPPELCTGGRYASYWNAFLLFLCHCIYISRNIADNNTVISYGKMGSNFTISCSSHACYLINFCLD